MSMQSEGKDAKGRNYDQVTRDGSSAAGTLGAGGTGDVDRDLMQSRSGQAQGGDSQQKGRTDDLLSSGSDLEQHQGFTPTEEAGELQTGLGGMGSLSTGNAGNRQSEGETQPGVRSDSMGSGADSGGAVDPGVAGDAPGSQHNDWGHSPEAPANTAGNRQSSGASRLPREGVMPGEEMGHLQHGQDSRDRKRKS